MKNRFFVQTLVALLLTACAPQLLAQSAATWAKDNSEALASITDETLGALLKQPGALEKLLSQVKTEGESDPLDVTRIAAITQYVMRPAGSAARTMVANAYLEAAQKVEPADVVCFFLDQLRWCGLPTQVEAIKAFTKSDKTGVAPLATITLISITDDRTSKSKKPPLTRYAKFNQDVAALSASARSEKLLAAFDDPDVAYAGAALRWARTTGGKKETDLWLAKLAAAQDPVRQIMLLDMLGERGDTTACEALSGFLTHAEDAVSAAAHQALSALSPATYVEKVCASFKDIPPQKATLAKKYLMQMKSDLLQKPLVTGYASFNPQGKRVALELFRERNIATDDTYRYAIESSQDLAAYDTAVVAYRFLRDTAQAKHAEVLINRLENCDAKARIVQEIQSAIAVAMRRDASGAYSKALAQSIQSGPVAAKPLAMETAARTGDATLLKAVEAVAANSDQALATAAIRALSMWSSSDAIPALMQQAVAASDAKSQILAIRGITKLASMEGVDKKRYEALWHQLKAQMKDEARKQELDLIFNAASK